jgi:hypothetical protein
MPLSKRGTEFGANFCYSFFSGEHERQLFQQLNFWADVDTINFFALANAGREQGDKIGRIFANWVTVHFGQCFLKIAQVHT